MRKNIYTILFKLFQLSFFLSSQFKAWWMFVCWKEEASSFTSKFNAVIIMRGFVTSVQFSSVAQSCPTLFDPMDCSMPGFPVHQLPELAQTHVHWVGDATQPSHPLLFPSPPAFNLFQHQGLVQWVSSLHQVPKYWSFSFSISPFKEYSGLISFRIDLVHLYLDILLLFVFNEKAGWRVCLLVVEIRDERDHLTLQEAEGRNIFSFWRPAVSHFYRSKMSVPLNKPAKRKGLLLRNTNVSNGPGWLGSPEYRRR